MVRRSLLALLCMMGLTLAPKAHAMDKVVTAAVLYEIATFYRTWTRDPKPDRKQRPLIKMSRELFKKDRRQWLNNLWQNLWIIQEDYIEGQAFKDNYAKVKSNNYIKGSKKKCPNFGFHGTWLSHDIFIDKTRKTIKNLAFLVFAVATLSGNRMIWLTGSERFKKFFKYFGWTDHSTHSPTTIKLDEDTIQALANAINANNP